MPIRPALPPARPAARARAAVRTRAVPLAVGAALVVGAVLVAGSAAQAGAGPSPAGGAPGPVAMMTPAGDTVPPTAPGAPVATAVGPTSVTLTWTPATDNLFVAGYDVFAATADFVYRAAFATTNTVTVTGLQPATPYRFYVVAQDPVGHRTAGPAAPAVVTAAGPGRSLVVHQHTRDFAPADAAIRVGLEALNASPSPVALARVSMRYWFTRDGGSRQVDTACESATVGCANVTHRVVPLRTPRRGADSYLRVGFTWAAGTLGGHAAAGPVSLRVTKADGSLFSETDDASWRPFAPSAAINSRVTVYVDGRLVFGTEP